MQHIELSARQAGRYIHGTCECGWTGRPRRKNTTALLDAFTHAATASNAERVAVISAWIGAPSAS